MSRPVILFNPCSVHRIGDFTLPMGLLMAAALIWREHPVVVIDQIVEKGWRKRLEDALRQDPICLGVSAMTGPQILEGLEASRLALRAGCPVVWGGIHPTIQPESTVAHELVDYVVAGEGEVTFAKLVRSLAAGRHGEGIPGVWWKEDGRPRCGGVRERFVVLDELPEIPYHLVDLRRYVKPSARGDTLNLYTSRGCPYRCTFCYNEAVNARRWRAFSAERCLRDVRRILADFPSVRHLQFWDDSFFTSLRRARELAEGLAELSPAVTWSALGAHVRDVSRMDDDYLATLRRSGCKEVLIGVESGSDRIREAIGKDFELEELFEANLRLRAFGITPTYTFLSGIPGEDDGDLRRTVEVMFRLQRDNPDAVLGNVKPLICYPGTAAYREALELGFEPPSTLEEWGEYTWGNYARMPYPWVTAARKRRLSHLYYYTVLMNPEYLFIRSRLFTTVARLLRPVASWRVRRFCFALPVESWGMNLVRKVAM